MAQDIQPPIVSPEMLSGNCPSDIGDALITVITAAGTMSQPAAHTATWTFGDWTYTEYDDGKVQLNQLRYKDKIIYST